MLYILVKQDKTAFKVGVTTDENLNRVRILHNKHAFNLAESYIVRANDQDVLQKLERQLITDYKPYKIEFEETVDGKDEFLDIKVLKDVIADIEYKAKKTHLGLTITKGINHEKYIEKKDDVKGSKSIKTFDLYDIDYSYFQKYARAMANRNDTKYPLREAFSDAIKLLQEKNPDIK